MFTLTKQTTPLPTAGQASVEIAPEMMEAGVDEFLSHDSEDILNTDPKLVVSWIYRAMTEVV